MLLNHEDYLQAVNKAELAAKAYYHTGVQHMSDTEYDALVDNIEQAGKTFNWHEGDALFTQVAGGTKPNGKNTITHSVPMLSLDKLKNEKDLQKFIEIIGENNIVLEPKLDGTALSVVYKNGKLFSAAGRGTGLTANDSTSKVLSSTISGLPQTLPEPINLEVRGELYIRDNDYEKAQLGRIERGKATFNNSRNAVAGAMNDEKDNSYIRMTFGAYEALGFTDNSYTQRMKKLEQLGFKPAISLMPKSEKFAALSLEKRIEAFGKLRPSLGVETDGIVLKCDSYTIRKSLGEGSHGPRYNKAWKYNADEVRVETTVRDIVYSIGKTGRLGIVAHFDPVVAVTLISKASLHNVKWIEERDIRIGSKIVIYRANGVIPYIETVLSNPENSKRWVAPTSCPKCDGPFDKDTELWRCPNPDCSVLGAIIYAGSKDVLDWDGFSTAIASELVESERVNDISDIFTLTQEELADLQTTSKLTQRKVRVGDKRAEKILQHIEASKKQPLARVITALSIRKMGRTMGRRVAAAFNTMDNILAANVEDFLSPNVEGVAENKATEYYNGFKNKRALIERLRKAGVNMGQKPSQRQTNSTTQNKLPLTGKKVVVTGSMKGSKLDGLSRTNMTELIEKHGGKPSSSVSSTTNILVCADTTSSKYRDAVAFGTVEILSPNDFAQRIGM